MRNGIVLPIALFSLVTATVSIARRLPAAADSPYDIEIVPSSHVLRWASLGHPTAAANLLYLRAVQYIGDVQANRRGWDKLWPVLDAVTDLDPAHGYAYQVGGTILGSVHRVQESNALLEKGIRHVPGRYIIPYLRAFNAFYYDGDFATAGRFVEHAARVPGAPEHLRQSALAMYVKGHRADAALTFLQSVRSQTNDSESLKAIDKQIRQAELEIAAGPLDEAVARYRERYGMSPIVVQLLLMEGFISRIPADPFGGTWIVGKDDRVRSTVNPFRFARREQIRMPPEPGVDPRRLQRNGVR